MSIVIAGTGYVGLVTGACLCEVGHSVFCVDIDAGRVERLVAGEVPFYEPGLAALVRTGVESKRLRFTTSLREAYQRSKEDRTLSAPVVMIAVGTPQGDDGAADLVGVAGGGARISAPSSDDDAVVVTKMHRAGRHVRPHASAMLRVVHRPRLFDVVSNPEFLKEGAAIEDFMKPDRVVVGVRRPEVAERAAAALRAVPADREAVPVDVAGASAEMTKYAANALLSTKISFINEMANLCERMGGDINDVRRGIGHDSRIGFAFLFPGVGYGGSAFRRT